jgi:hypothetical protein
MPVRLSTSPVLEWPDRSVVDRAVRELAVTWSAQRPELTRLGYRGRCRYAASPVIPMSCALAKSDTTIEARR